MERNGPHAGTVLLMLLVTGPQMKKLTFIYVTCSYVRILISYLIHCYVANTLYLIVQGAAS